MRRIGAGELLFVIEITISKIYFRDCAVLHGLEDPEGDFSLGLRSSCERLLDPIDGRMTSVFHFDPIRRPAGAIGPIAALRNQALQTEVAGGAKEVGPNLALLEIGDENAFR